MRYNSGKTRMLLGDYTMSGGNVARLLLALRELERWDILEDPGFQDSLRAGVAMHVAKQQQIQQREPPEQDPEGTLRDTFIPILYEPCQIPDIFLYICPLDFTKVENIQSFWARLRHSLQPLAVASVAPLPSTSHEEWPPCEESDCRDVDIPDASNSTRDTGGATGGTTSGASGGSKSAPNVGGLFGSNVFHSGRNTSRSRSAKLSSRRDVDIPDASSST